MTAKINICLVDYNNVIGIAFYYFFNRFKTESETGRRIRIGNYNGFVYCHIVIRVKCKVLFEWDFRIRYMIKLGKYRVKAVCDIRKAERVFLVGKRHKCKIQHLVRTVCHDYFIVIYAENLSRLFSQSNTLRIGIKLKPACFLLNRLCDRLRRRKRRFVRVELYIFFVLRLFTRGVRNK